MYNFSLEKQKQKKTKKQQQQTNKPENKIGGEDSSIHIVEKQRRCKDIDLKTLYMFFNVYFFFILRDSWNLPIS